MKDADKPVQLAQMPVAVPGMPPLPLPPSALPQGLPPSTEHAIGESIARAGRRLEYIGSEIRHGDLSHAAGHALAGQPFPPEVDDPQPLAMSPLNQATVDGKGREISQRAIDMKPPGDCEPDRWRQLQSNVDAACKTAPLSCKSSSLSQSDIQTRFMQNMACGTARDRINGECFAGGDYEHRQQAYNAWRRASECQDQLLPR